MHTTTKYMKIIGHVYILCAYTCCSLYLPGKYYFMGVGIMQRSGTYICTLETCRFKGTPPVTIPSS